MLCLVSIILFLNFSGDVYCQIGGNNNPQLPVYTPDLPCNDQLVHCNSKGQKIAYDFATHSLTGELKDFNPNLITIIWLHGSDPQNEEPYKEQFMKKNIAMYNRYRNLFDCDYSKLLIKDNNEVSLKNLPYAAKCIGEVIKAVLPTGFWAIGIENIGSVMLKHLGDHFESNQFIRAMAIDPACVLSGEEPNLDLIAQTDFSSTKECFHACGNKYGVKCGNNDIYLNLKEEGPQPGCPTDDARDAMECSKNRVMEVINESILPSTREFVFYGFRCDHVDSNFDYDCPDVDANYQCGLNHFSQYHAGGKFILNTTDQAPYALGQYDNLEMLRNNKDVYFLE